MEGREALALLPQLKLLAQMQHFCGLPIRGQWNMLNVQSHVVPGREEEEEEVEVGYMYIHVAEG